MTFEENPFRVLNVSIHDTKTTIVDAADDLAFAQPDDEKIFAQARDILLNPRKRIAAEVRQLVGENIDIENLSEDVLRVDKKFSALNAEELRQQINAARAKSKFPAVNDTKAIADELKNLRDEIRSKIHDKFQSANQKMRVSFANFLVDKLAAGNFGVVVEDFFDSYKLEMTASLDETSKQISNLLKRIKADADKNSLDDLAFHVTEFVRARKPLDEFSILLGTNKFDDSEEIFYAVRATAIDLYNEKDLVDDPLKITRLLAEKFSYLPKLADEIRKDVAFLEKAKSNQPSRIFLDAKAALDAIKRSIERGVRFDKYAEQQNLKFYHTQFKAQHESILREFMNRQGYKPDELKLLNLMAASIYLQMGAAMTWTPYPELAFEMFQKALPYAGDSGDAKLIMLAHKRVAEWREAVNRNSSNWLWWTIGAIVVLYLLS
ncbi:MAG: hypothetical protein IJ774_13435 [Selenomonadaceae bacterium]|nr:hypothetical protein [Selenomonadaceae bacterium]